MKLQQKSKTTSCREPAVSFRFLISSMISHFNDAVGNNQVSIENRVPAGILIDTEQDKISAVICEMIATVVSHAHNSTISITAERFGEIVIVNVEDGNNNNGYALSFSLMSLEEKARMAGGNLSVKDVQKRVATISLSFLNTPENQQVIYS